MFDSFEAARIFGWGSVVSSIFAAHTEIRLGLSPWKNAERQRILGGHRQNRRECRANHPRLIERKKHPLPYRGFLHFQGDDTRRRRKDKHQQPGSHPFSGLDSPIVPASAVQKIAW